MSYGGYTYLKREETNRYKAACDSLVFSSITASGFLEGGSLVAVAAPRSNRYAR